MLKTNEAVIVDAIRTPMAASKNGAFRHLRADTLLARLIEAMLQRNSSVDVDAFDDLIIGCVNQTLEQGFNVARHAAFLAGLPTQVPAQTVNRLCGSSMSALHSAAQGIISGCGEQYLVGGVEHMGHVPMLHGVDVHPALSKHIAKASLMMGLTAELQVQVGSISRRDQDLFALRSHKRAAAAQQSGGWQRELIPIEAHNDQGFNQLIDYDEVVRPDLTMEQLAALEPAFIPGKGSVTAGNASAMSDGASMMLVMSASRAEQLQLKARARIIGMSIVGCDAAAMGYGPIPATEKVLRQVGLSLPDIDYIELNEAFAAQSLSVLSGLNLLDQFDDKVNVNGGAIALGHPLGCSGSRIVTTLLNVLEQQDGQFGLATMCIGMGQGIATVIERLE